MSEMLVVATENGDEWYVREECGYDDPALRWDRDGEEMIESPTAEALSEMFETREEAIEHARSLCQPGTNPGFLIYSEFDFGDGAEYMYEDEEYCKNFWLNVSRENLRWNSIAGLPEVLEAERVTYF